MTAEEDIKMHQRLTTKVFLNSCVKNLEWAEEIARRWRKL